MKRAFECGLVLLAAVAAAPRPALANPLQFDGALYFFAASAPPPPTVARPLGYLGVDVRDVTPDQLAVLKLKEAHGAEIMLVDHDAPAGKAGLREHDVVLQMNGQTVVGGDQLRRMLHDCPPGTGVTLIVSHDGLLRTVSTQMANREEVERQAWEQHLTVPEPAPSDNAADYAPTPASPAPPAVHGGNSFIGNLLMNPSYTGAMLETMSTQLADFFGVSSGIGLLVRSVETNSPADRAGMRAGDVVLQANARPVATSADWAKAVKNSHGHPLTIVVLRDKKQQTLTLTPDGKKRSSLDAPDQLTPTQQPTPAAVAHIGLYWIPRS